MKEIKELLQKAIALCDIEPAIGKIEFDAAIERAEKAEKELSELEALIKNHEHTIATLEEKINKQKDEIEELESRSDADISVHTGLDTIHIHSEKGNLAELEKCEKFARSISLTGELI